VRCRARYELDLGQGLGRRPVDLLENPSPSPSPSPNPSPHLLIKRGKLFPVPGAVALDLGEG
jgi:hypothetical protein